MPVNTYETLFLLDAPKLTADADGVRSQVHHVLERHGAHIEVSRPWDYNHKLAYPIEKQKKGAFHIVYYTLDGRKQADLEKDLRLVEVVLRHMTTKIDPKWHEEIMRVAREDHGTGFALRGMQDEAPVQTDPAAIGAAPAPEGGDGGDGPPGGPGMGGPRRGPRRAEMADKPE